MAFVAAGVFQFRGTQNEAEVPYSLSAGIGGVLSNVPPVLYPEKSAGPLATSRLDVDTGKTSLRPGPQELLYLDLHLPTHIELPVSVVEAASVRVSQQGGSLTESEAISVLRDAGWPTELIPAALRVAWCESKWSPYAVGDSGRSVGLFQLNKQTWFRYAGEDPEMWADPVVNARTALATYYYDIGRGYQPFAQWSCRP